MTCVCVVPMMMTASGTAPFAGRLVASCSCRYRVEALAFCIAARETEHADALITLDASCAVEVEAVPVALCT